jgi:predicted membrane protein
MTTHWLHVSLSYALVLGGFAALTIASLARHAAAKRRLAALEPRRGSAAAGGTAARVLGA